MEAQPLFLSFQVRPLPTRRRYPAIWRRPFSQLCACIAVVFLSAAAEATAQTWWNLNFERWALGSGPMASSTWSNSSPAPAVSALVTDAGPPQGHVLTLSVDSSACTSKWSAWWTIFPYVTFAGYDPDRTLLSFDAQASKVKPFTARLSYVDQGGSFATRNLVITVNPTNAGTFEHYSIPLSAFTSTYLSGNPPDYPTAIEFFIAGDPATPDTSWGFESGNMLSVDNVAYTVMPPLLSISGSTNGVIISWPTSVTAFVLQQSSIGGPGSWTDVTNAPVANESLNQVVVSPASSQCFYRLRSP